MNFLITALGLCCLLLGVAGTEFSKPKPPPPPRCGCTEIDTYDSDYLSPWRYYKYPDFPFLCRIMQRGVFKSMCTVISEFWVIGCSILFQDEKGLEIVVDRSLVDKRRSNVTELIYPFAKHGTCKFVLIHLGVSLNPPNTPRNATICPVCLPTQGDYYYGTTVLPHYINPVGYCCQFSTTCFAARKLTLDCCHRENYGCNEDGRTCSSDLYKAGETLGCQGLLGAPLLRLLDGRWHLVAIMCDIMGCEGNQPCSYFEDLGHYSSFIRKNAKLQ